MSPGARKALLFAGLAITLILVFSTENEETQAPGEPPRAATTTRRATAPQPSAPLPTLNTASLARETLDSDAVDIFRPKSWYIAPPPPKPVPPPPPSAPPLPFTYLGRIEEGDVTKVFVARQGSNYSVRKGDVIDSTYRVDEITPGAITFTYLPLNTRQTLPIGGAN